MDEPDNRIEEYQAIVFAGGAGSKLYPLPSDTMPKSLLPIANRPLISFQLDLLENSQFSEVIVVTNKQAAPFIEKYVSEMYKGRLKVQLVIADGNLGTAEVLRTLKDKITTDFIVVPDDLVADEHLLHSMVDLHRTQEAAVCVLLKRVPKRGEKKNADDELDLMYIGLSEGEFCGVGADKIKQAARLVYFREAADVDSELKIRKSLMSRHNTMKLHTRLKDLHLYVFARWVLDVLDQHRSITSIQGELLPFIVNAQHTRSGQALAPRARGYQAYSMSSAPSSVLADPVQCFAFTAPEDATCVRSNSLTAYRETNRMVAEKLSSAPDFVPLPLANYPQSSQVGAGSIVSHTVRIAEKSQVKQSVIGKHCKIGSMVRISGSVIMDYVDIQDKVTIENCIIANDCVIGSKCSLTNCVVEEKVHVPESSKTKAETITQANRRL